MTNSINAREQLSPSLPPNQEHQPGGGKRVIQPHSGSSHPPTFRRGYVFFGTRKGHKRQVGRGQGGAGHWGLGGACRGPRLVIEWLMSKGFNYWGKGVGGRFGGGRKEF